MLLDNNHTTTAAVVVRTIYAKSPFTKELLFYQTIFIRILFAGSLCLAGVVSNIINILIFYRQGPMSSSPTVILTGLACSDLTISIFGTVRTCLTCVDTFTKSFFVFWEAFNFNIYIITRPLNLLTQITCVYTTLLGFERVVSVVFPFKVRSLFTPKRSLIILVAIFIFLCIVHAPDLYEKKAVVVYSVRQNVSYLSFIPIYFFPQEFSTIYFTISPIGMRFATVIIVVLCNVVIAWKVQSSQRFRKSNASISTTTSQQETTNTCTRTTTAQTNTKNELHGDSTKNSNNNPNTREVKVAKDIKMLRMITIVSALFVACYTPTVLYIIFFHMVYDYGVDFHWDVEDITFDVIMAFQYLNSCLNILIYYNMSARYKEEFSLLCRPWGKKG